MEKKRLKCETVRNGFECILMTRKGCAVDGCSPIVEECEGCKKIGEYDGTMYCNAFIYPHNCWKNGACVLATNLEKTVSAKAKLNPIKASKRR
jgi:hypothetical protein